MKTEYRKEENYIIQPSNWDYCYSSDYFSCVGVLGKNRLHHYYTSEFKIHYEPGGSWSRCLSPVSVVLSGWESSTPPGWDTNPLQVSSQQTLVLIYLPRKDGRLSWLRQKRRSHKDSNLGRAGIELETSWSNHAPPKFITKTLLNRLALSVIPQYLRTLKPITFSGLCPRLKVPQLLNK